MSGIICYENFSVNCIYLHYYIQFELNKWCRLYKKREEKTSTNEMRMALRHARNTAQTQARNTEKSKIQEKRKNKKKRGKNKRK